MQLLTSLKYYKQPISASKHDYNIPTFTSGYNALQNAKQNQLINLLNLLINNDLSKRLPFIITVKDNFVEKIVNVLIQDKPFIVSIAGKQASGKTTFANILHNSMLEHKLNTTIIHDDDYFTDISKEVQQFGGIGKLIESGYSLDAPYHTDLPLIETHLQKLKQGLAIYSPQYDFLTSSSKSQATLKTPSKLIIHEGMFALSKIFENVSDIKLYCEAKANICKDRWYNRTVSRGVAGEIADTHYNNALKAAKKYIEPDKDSADLVLNTSLSAENIRQFVNEIIEAVISTRGGKYGIQ